MMRTRPYTNIELFREVCKLVELPKILDYYLPASDVCEIKSYEYSTWNSLNYGGSEGIYLDIGLEFTDHEIIRLGTFKTLNDNTEAMRTMGKLLADLVVAIAGFINKNIDDFDWTGYAVRGFVNGKPTSYGIIYSSLDRAMQEIENSVDQYDAVRLFDKSKREYHYFVREESGEITQVDLENILAK